MGFDKASMLVDGVPCAMRIAAVLQTATVTAIEVGPGISELRAVQDHPSGRGPLTALSIGADALRTAGHQGPALVVACDLPLLTLGVLTTLSEWPGIGSVVPVVGGWPQPLCACWSAAHLAKTGELVAAGARSMRALLEEPGVELVDEAHWPGPLDPRALADLDNPADLDGLGLTWSLPGSETS